jgi:hypothetical protein
MGGAYSTAF